MIVVTTYLLYFIVSALLTFWVGRTLYKNGRVFLVESFAEPTMADSVNHLLLVGFYLVNFGFVSLFLKFGIYPTNLIDAIEYISTKLGVVLVVLGIMHFFNMYNIAKIRSKSKKAAAPQDLSHLHAAVATSPSNPALPTS